MVSSTEPEAGYFRVRTHRNGPWAPVRVWKVHNGQTIISKRVRKIPPLYRAEWNPYQNDPFGWEPFELYADERNVDEIYHPFWFLKPITEDEFQWMTTLKELA